ncbi:MAG: hypothetical protein IKG14_03195 [Clostridia bacterium]|nr:hypothetical protein [Clostridia bacterium]
MSIITFTNNNLNETGQTLAASAVATCMAIEHNFRILLMCTDFNNNTMESCYFNNYKKKQTGLFQGMVGRQSDISNGMEGLIRVFASNRASSDVIKSFARPILSDGRLDILPSPKTKDLKEYKNLSVYFSQIAEFANQSYDMVLVDLSKEVTKENRNKVYDLSSVIVMGLIQNLESIEGFAKRKAENSYYQKNNILLCVDKYNQNSKYTCKNIARYLNEKDNPVAVPYNILYSDSCSEGQIIDYILSVRQLFFTEGKDGYFYECLKDVVEKINYKREEAEYGRTST